MDIARQLEHSDMIKKVHYPGLKSDAGHEIASRQMSDFGGMVTAVLHGGETASRRMLERCRLFALAESLGGVESLIEHPGIMTHASVPAEQRKALGIDDGLIRLSVGVEDIDDLLAELEYALPER
jgi:cystathionine beta-lyase/cystathionine gamma-synthase